MAFCFDEADDATASCELARLGLAEKGFAAMTVVGWNFPGLKHKEQRRENYLATLGDCVAWLSTRFGSPVLLLRQVEGRLDFKGDDFVIEQLRERLKHRIVVGKPGYSPAIMRGILRKASFFLGSRMHSCIFALQVGTPTVAIGYLPKTRGIFQDIGVDEFVVEIDECRSERILGLAMKALEQSDRFEKASQRAVALGEEARRGFADVLGKCLGERRP